MDYRGYVHERRAGAQNYEETGAIHRRDHGSVLIAGCTVGPNYHRPVVQTPTAYRDLSENPQVQAQAASYADLPWWQVFQDPQLQELIRTALKQNYDLQLATERINAARAQLAITRSNLVSARSKETAISAAEKSTTFKPNSTF